MPVVDPESIGPNYNPVTSQGGGGYDPNDPYGNREYLSRGGGYDPVTGYQGTSNSVGGQAAISETYMGGKDNFAGGYYGEQVEAGGGGYDPKEARLESSGLTEGGGTGGDKQPATVGFTGGSAASGVMAGSSNDWRVRVSLNDGSKSFYKDSSNRLMAPLSATNGVIFPYTPSVSVTHQATYNSTQLTHSNYAQQFYQGSDVSDISISGEFTVQDAAEGQYLLASIYFFRAATKMFFGLDSQSGLASGNPPPIVYLHGYGDYYFPAVPCVLTSFSHALPNEVDYVEVPITETNTTLVQSARPAPNPNITNNLVGGNYGSVQGAEYVPSLLQSSTQATTASTQATVKSAPVYTYNTTTTSRTTRLPATSTLSITLRPVYSRKSLHEKFNLNDFAAGKLINGGGSFL